MTDVQEPAKRDAKAQSRMRRAIEWFTLSSRIAQARASERQNADLVLFLTRADRAVRAADRLLDSPQAFDREPAFALELYAQAAYWLGRVARPDAPAGTALAELIAPEPEGSTWFSPVDESVVKSLSEPFHVRAEHSTDESERRARAAQNWLAGALGRAHARVSSVSELRLQRAYRVYPALLVTLGLVLGGAVLAVRAVQGPDLALGRPWRASSSLFACNVAARQCGGVPTAIFFHTRDEENPWLEIDLEGVRRFGRVEVDNRSDGGAERAVPLILEVSTDGKNYRQLAERTQLFSNWVAKFPATEARYVRLRAPRRTMLHLERVSVRR
jgi:hypothetical protein